MRDLVSKLFIVEDNEQIFYKEIAGDHSETKPTTGIADGSIFLETDTGAVFFFNEKTSAWVEQFSFKG